VRIGAQGTFDNFNIITYKGSLANGMGLMYEQLMAGSLDEPSAQYGQIAEWVSYPPDYASVTYKLRDEARWHDGKPITPEDVIFSFEQFRKVENNPRQAFYYKNVVKAEKTGEREVTFTFNQKNNRELPQIVGQLFIVPKHYYEGKGPDGKKHDPAKTTLDVPVGSGAYKIKTFEPGRYIVYERVKDYWGNKLPINVGQNNFDQIRYEYYKDRQIVFQAFTAGKLDFYAENSAKNWATGYDFPALKAGKVVRSGDVVLENLHPMQAFVLNTRRPKFADPRVRRALGLMMDFEWLNKNIFFGQYKRVSSFFENSELAATGLPQGKELEILNEVKDQVPPEVFTTEFKNPVSGSSRAVRANTRAALRLMREAGWEVKNGYLANVKTGEPFTIEFLLVSEDFKRVVMPYIQSLKRIGVKGNVRLIDAAQYERRVPDFNFDVITGGWAQSESPGNEQRDYWGSEAADRQGSRNWVGIKNPAVDKLIGRIIFAKDREELVAASRALDRVLLWNFYVIPQWYAPKERFAYWNRLSHPKKLPSRSIGFPSIWWYDQEKAAKLGR
jgi:microcin C transport system substrate-binding protein